MLSCPDLLFFVKTSRSTFSLLMAPEISFTDAFQATYLHFAKARVKFQELPWH